MINVADRTTRRRIAEALPDVPRWLETRWMLRLDTTEVFGSGEAPDVNVVSGDDPVTKLISMLTGQAGLADPAAGEGCVVRDPPMGLVSVIGRPVSGAVREAVRRSDKATVLAQVDDAGYVEQVLPGWKRETAKLHWLVDSEKLFGPLTPRTDMFGLPEAPLQTCGPEGDDSRVELLTTAGVQDLTGATEELKRELTIAVLRGPVAAVWIGGKPVSFCHAQVQTEGLWDVSIDTLDQFRGRGYAKKAVRYLAALMIEEHRKRPVWGAVESNTPSLRLARALGFRPIDEIVVFERV